MMAAKSALSVTMATCFQFFRGGAHHRRAADVDVFNRVFEGAAGFGDGGGEGVEVYGDQIDVADAVFGHFGGVRFQIAPAEDAAVNFRVQRFHAAVEHFGETGVVGDFDHGDACVGQELGRAAGREDSTPLRRGRGQIRLRRFCRKG